MTVIIMSVLKLAHIRPFVHAKHCLQNFTFIFLCNPQNNSMKEMLLLTLLYR